MERQPDEPAGSFGADMGSAARAGSWSGYRARALAAIRMAVLPVRSAERRREWFSAQLKIEEEARTTFLLFPIALIGGVLTVHGLALSPPVLPALCLGAILLVAAQAFLIRPLPRLVLSALAAIILGAGLAQSEIERTDTTIFSGEATVHILGRVVARDTDERDRLRYLVDIVATERPTLSRPPGRARILVGARHEPIALGDSFDGLVRLMPPSGPAAPGTYDFAFQPFFQGLGAYGFALGAPAEVHEARSLPLSEAALSARLAAHVEALRTRMTARIRDALPGASGGIAAALITGQRDGIPPDTEAWFRSAGLAHVLSISGLHMALVTGFAMLFARRLLALSPAIALSLPIKKLAAIVALAIATAYLLVSGSSVATDRAYVMLVVMLAAVLFDRAAITMRNLAIAAIVIIVLTPHAVLTASFQMSFAATAALIGGYRWVETKRQAPVRPEGWIRKALSGLGAIAFTSILAGAATAPYSAYHFGQISGSSLLANLLTMPMFSVLVMPAALIGCVLMPIGLEALPLHVMGLGLDYVIFVARTLASSFPEFATRAMAPAALLLFSLTLLVAFVPASKLRLLAIPLAMFAMASASGPRAFPELLVHENGEEVAILSEHGELSFFRERPNGFIAEQWERSFAGVLPLASISRDRARLSAECEDGLCVFETRSGLRIAWTDDWRLAGAACDAGSVAIVARASRLESCRSGAHLATLRTLRRSGSLAISKNPDGTVRVERSIGANPNAWNRHRHAPWPEFWRKKETAEAALADGREASEVDSGGDSN